MFKQKSLYIFHYSRMSVLVGGLVLLIVLTFATVAYSSLGFTLKSTYDIDREVTSAYSEIKIRVKPKPFDVELKWKHNFLPRRSESVQLTMKLLFWKKLTLKFVRKLHIKDTWKLTITYLMKPVTLEWVRRLKPGVNGTISLKYSKTF